MCCSHAREKSGATAHALQNLAEVRGVIANAPAYWTTAVLSPFEYAQAMQKRHRTGALQNLAAKGRFMERVMSLMRPAEVLISAAVLAGLF
jgi:hypothetical protein